MAATPRWITAAEVATEDEIKVATVTLTDAQIKAAGTPVVIIPATEVLDYSGFPTSLPVIVKATAVLNASAGAYTNVAAAGVIQIVYGSDWSLSIGLSAKIQADGSFETQPLDNQARNTFYAFVLAEDALTTDSIQDNAVAIVVDNDGTGDFTDGNAANTLKVTVYYTVSDL